MCCDGVQAKAFQGWVFSHFLLKGNSRIFQEVSGTNVVQEGGISSPVTPLREESMSTNDRESAHRLVSGGMTVITVFPWCYEWTWELLVNSRACQFFMIEPAQSSVLSLGLL